MKFNRPISRAANLGIKLVLLAIPFQIAAAALHRFEVIDSKLFFALMGASALLVIGAVICALIAYFSLWHVAAKGGVKALVTLLIAFAMIAPIAFSIWQNYPLPSINDVSTDIERRPEFNAIKAIRKADAAVNPPWGDEEKEIHKSAYPELKPHFYTISLEDALKPIYTVAKLRGWKILQKLEQSKKSAIHSDTLYIEATWRSLIIGFKNDAVLRIRDEDDKIRIDIRSAARAGRYDFRSNAKEIQTFLSQLDRQILSFAKSKPDQ